MFGGGGAGSAYVRAVGAFVSRRFPEVTHGGADDSGGGGAPPLLLHESRAEPRYAGWGGALAHTCYLVAVDGRAGWGEGAPAETAVAVVVVASCAPFAGTTAAALDAAWAALRPASAPAPTLVFHLSPPAAVAAVRARSGRVKLARRGAPPILRTRATSLPWTAAPPHRLGPRV